MVKGTKRFKLLIDEMLPRKSKFPQLNNFHNIRHIVHDFKSGGMSDEKLVILAKKENRTVVTKNIKHLQKLGVKHKVDVIGLTETALPQRIDSKIMAILRKKRQAKMSGSFTKIAGGQ